MARAKTNKTRGAARKASTLKNTHQWIGPSEHDGRANTNAGFYGMDDRRPPDKKAGVIKTPN